MTAHTFQPNEHYRYVLRHGLYGFDVWAIQIAFDEHGAGLVEDGSFGPSTEAASRVIQRDLGVVVDGIVGPQTQASLCALACSSAEKHRTPKGLLKGICFGESGGIIPATTPVYGNGSRDYGPFQDNETNPSQAVLRKAFSPHKQAESLAAALSQRHSQFFGQRGAPGDEGAWKLAVLSYNWPAAAEQLAAGHGETWVYTESGTGARRHLADPAPWVERFGIHGVSSGMDWCDHYVASKIGFVESWAVA